MLLTKVEIR